MLNLNDYRTICFKEEDFKPLPLQIEQLLYTYHKKYLEANPDKLLAYGGSVLDQSTLNFDPNYEENLKKQGESGGVSFHPVPPGIQEVLRKFYSNTILGNPIMTYWIQTVGQGKSYVLPHNDNDGEKNNRLFNWIYLLDAGGDNVITSWWEPKPEYKDQPILGVKGVPFSKLDLIERAQVKEKKWSYLNTERLHSVEGLTRERFALSCFPPISNVLG